LLLFGFCPIATPEQRTQRHWRFLHCKNGKFGERNRESESIFLVTFSVTAGVSAGRSGRGTIRTR